MLGQQSEHNLKQILDIICETEIVIESHRQSICRDSKFSPYSAFCRIDRLALEQINSQDLLSFFKENGAIGVLLPPLVATQQHTITPTHTLIGLYQAPCIATS